MVRRTMDKWVASEEVWDTVNKILSSCFWLHHVEGEKTMGIGLVRCIWGRYGALLKVRYSFHIFVYIHLNVRSTMGWWVAFEEGMMHHHKVSYSHPAFGYILLNVRSTMGWWVASEEGMMHHHKVRYSHPAFGYILLNVRSTMGWWVASEEGMMHHH